LVRPASYDALPPAGTLIVYETLIDDDRRTNTAGLLQALNIQAWTGWSLQRNSRAHQPIDFALSDSGF
jgi:hypothetical protein